MTEISIATSPVYTKIVDAINDCFGKNYKGWYKSYFWTTADHDEFVWFPKMAEAKAKAYEAPNRSHGWLNILSEDGTVLTEENPDDTRTSITEDDLVIRITFGWYEGLGYKFIGVFKIVPEECRPKHRVYKRISDKINLSVNNY